MIVFKELRWKNFLATGNVWTTMELSSNDLTLVIGENGSGKSTMLDALCFVLFGKAYRSINKPQLVNSINRKDCIVEVEFFIGKSHYHVRRGIKPAFLEIHKNDKAIELEANARDQQEHLEKNILKLNYSSFTQIAILGSSSFIPFMQLSAAARREIIEDLLDIKIFTTMNMLLKEKVQHNKEALNEIRYKIELEDEKISIHEKHLRDTREHNKRIKEAQRDKIRGVEKQIHEVKDLLKIKTSEYDAVHAQIHDQGDVKRSIQELRFLRDKVVTTLKSKRDFIEFFETSHECPKCQSPLTDDHKSRMIQETESEIEKLNKGLRIADERDAKAQERRKEIDAIRVRLNEIQTEISELEGQEKSLLLLRRQLESSSVKQEERSVKEEETKIREAVKQKKLLNKRKKTELQRKELYDVGMNFLKDGGIKAQIIRQYIPVMNQLINKYLAAMEFFVQFELDDRFKETIRSRHRDEFSYTSFSEGEKMRIDLALLLTWRAIAKMKNSTNTNLLILDEIFDASLDSSGCEELMKLLNDLSKNTNVFVISHKQDTLIDKFKSIVRFEKIKNFSHMM